MSTIDIKGSLAFKGERGYSAYEIAVQNGFVGSEQDWLARLGTSNHFEEDKTLKVTTEVGEDEFDIPDSYTSSSFLEVYVEGRKLASDEYALNTDTKKITLTLPLEVVGTRVEMVVVTMSTNELPIVTTVNESSTDNTVPSAKCVYDELNDIKTSCKKVEGTIADIPTNSSKDATFDYPESFNRSNCVVVSVMNGYGNNWSCNVEVENAPVITNVTLEEEKIHVYMKNTNQTAMATGKFKILLMKIGG